MRSTTLSSLTCAEPRLAMISCRPVRISRAAMAAEAGMMMRYQMPRIPVTRANCVLPPLGVRALPGTANLDTGPPREVETALLNSQASAVANVLLGRDQEILGDPREMFTHGRS